MSSDAAYGGRWLQGRRALVTGGAGGIGYACARALAAEGAHVTITTRKPDAGDRAVAAIGEVGSAEALVVDLADTDAPVVVADHLGSRSDRLDIVVNNAGVTWGAPFEEYPPGAWDKVMNLDVAVPFRLVQALLPLLEAAAGHDDPARVINIGSIDGHTVGGFDNFAYAAAKAGIHQLTRVLAYRLGPHGVAVNCVAPSPTTTTRMTASLLDDHEDQLVGRHPLGRVCRPDDIAGAVVYLAGPTATFLTGVILPVDGGLSIGPWWPADSIRTDDLDPSTPAGPAGEQSDTP